MVKPNPQAMTEAGETTMGTTIDTARLRALKAASKIDRLFAVGPDGDELATDLVENDSVYGPLVALADVIQIHDDRGEYSREEMNAKLRWIAEAVNALPELLDENKRLSDEVDRLRAFERAALQQRTREALKAVHGPAASNQGGPKCIQ